MVEELQAEGARVAYAVADVADYDALAEAADKCRRLFGGFDTWVNNAGVSIYGPIRETTLEDQRRLFETNYWGMVNGSLIAAEHLRARPGGGTIVNVGSILGDAPMPVQGVYSASKHAVKGFTNAFRMELMREDAPVAVSLVKPAAVDTPYPKHARNLTGYAVQNPQPVYATHVVADTVLWCASPSDPRDHGRRGRARHRRLSTPCCQAWRNHFSRGSLLLRCGTGVPPTSRMTTGFMTRPTTASTKRFTIPWSDSSAPWPKFANIPAIPPAPWRLSPPPPW